MKRLAPLLALAALFLEAACSPPHIGTYTPKRRDYTLEAAPDQTVATAEPGSLWQEGKPASLLFSDARALRVNDLVVVKIEEVADAKRRADTELNHSSEAQFQINEFLGLLARLKQIVPQVDPQISGSVGSRFTGEGYTGRTERLTATVPAIVRKVLPNGNLFIEGHRVVLVNNEEQHFYISGVIRPIDIDQENSIKSTMVADAEIEFTGRGVLSDNQNQGWMSRYLGWLWPF